MNRFQQILEEMHSGVKKYKIVRFSEGRCKTLAVVYGDYKEACDEADKLNEEAEAHGTGYKYIVHPHYVRLNRPQL